MNRILVYNLVLNRKTSNVKLIKFHKRTKKYLYNVERKIYCILYSTSGVSKYLHTYVYIYMYISVTFMHKLVVISFQLTYRYI